MAGNDGLWDTFIAVDGSGHKRQIKGREERQRAPGHHVTRCGFMEPDAVRPAGAGLVQLPSGEKFL
ncbi:MAG TPA: hypothetical protein VFD30_18835 [Terriglobia bacterium]|jgi:hypothetical protein|nr:hypothetical protein [Terriglobia bacterium]